MEKVTLTQLPVNEPLKSCANVAIEHEAEEEDVQLRCPNGRFVFLSYYTAKFMGTEMEIYELMLFLLLLLFATQNVHLLFPFAF